MKKRLKVGDWVYGGYGHMFASSSLGGIYKVVETSQDRVLLSNKDDIHYSYPHLINEYWIPMDLIQYGAWPDISSDVNKFYFNGIAKSINYQKES